MVVQLDEAVPVVRRLLCDYVDNENAVYVPLRAGGPLTRVYCAADVPEYDDEEWLWNGRVPVGCLTAIVGPRGVGKSFLVADIAARLSNGTPWPDEPDTRVHEAETCIITTEDHVARGITRRLRACGADLSCVHIVDFRDENGKPGTLTAAAIEDMTLHMHGLKLIVIDPFCNLIDQEHGRPPGEVKALLQELAALAERIGVGIIVVNATDKASAGKAGRNRADVLAFLDAGARVVWTVEEDPGEPGRSLWLPSRNNLGEGREGLAFRVEGTPMKIVWDPEPVALRSDDLKPAAQRRATKAAVAADWLEELLDEGSIPAAEVRRTAALAGISRGALYEAKGKLGVLSVKETDTPNGSWSWRLPEETAICPEDSNILLPLIRNLSNALTAQLTAEAGDPPVGSDVVHEGGANDGEGAHCATPHPNPPPQGGRGPDNASEEHEGARCATPHPNPPPQGGRGPDNTGDGHDGVRVVTCHAGLSPQGGRGPERAAIRNLAEDSKVLTCLMTALRQVIQGQANAGTDAGGRAASDAQGGPECADLPDDSKVLTPA